MTPRLVVLAVTAATTSLVAVGEHTASLFPGGEDPRTECVLRLNQGPVRGLLRDGVCQYLGLRFAAPLTLRFAPPEPLAPWMNTTQNATTPGPQCLQTTGGDEDCLYLNLFTPTDGRPAPLLIYYHGGSFLSGQATTKAANLSLSKHAIVAAPQYRLGVFGFFDDANVGLMDQKLALNFLHENAANLNATRIGLFGCSAGGASIVNLLLDEQAQNLFASAAIESTGGHQGWMGDDVRQDDDFMSFALRANYSQRLMRDLECETVEQLQTIDADTLYAASLNYRFAPALKSQLNGEDEYPLRLLRTSNNTSNVSILIGGQSCESCADAANYLGPPTSNVSDAQFIDALKRAGFDAIIGAERVFEWYTPRRRREGNWRAFARVLSDSGHACNAALHFRALAVNSQSFRSGSLFRYFFAYTGDDQKYPGATHCSLEDWIWQYGADKAGTPLGDALATWWTRLAETGDVNDGSFNMIIGNNDTTLPRWPPSTTPEDDVMFLGLDDDMTPRLNRSLPDTVRPECDHWKPYIGW